MSDVAAILLAAGRSSRMGAFKPLLPFGDSTVIDTCLDNLRLAGIDEVVVVVGHRGGEVRDQLASRAIRFATNPDPESEMSASIALGIEQVDPDQKAVLISLVDHPAVPAGVVEQLIEEWQRTNAQIIQPEYRGHGGHPLLIDLAYRHELLNLDPSQGLRALLASHRDAMRRLPVDCPFVARDMDTWEDYQRLHLDVFGVLPRET